MKPYNPNIASVSRIASERVQVRYAYRCGIDAACEDLPREANPYRWRAGIIAAAQAEAWDNGWTDAYLQGGA